MVQAHLAALSAQANPIRRHYLTAEEKRRAKNRQLKRQQLNQGSREGGNRNQEKRDQADHSDDKKNQGNKNYEKKNQSEDGADNHDTLVDSATKSLQHTERVQQRELLFAAANEDRMTSLIAALLVPMVVVLALPGLTEHWYVVNDAMGFVVESRPDPPLLITGLSISFILTVFANAFLLFRLVETHPRFFTFTGSFFLVIHLIIDFTSLLIFAIQHDKPDGYVLSTAFWLTTSSSITTLVVLGLLGVDCYVTSGFRAHGTGVSPRQRSLVIAFDIFLLVVIIGTVANKYLIDLDFLDALYFVIQTVITTGFGDITPLSTGSQIFAIFYNTIGILTFAIVVAFVRATALEAMQSEYKTQEVIIMRRFRSRGVGDGESNNLAERVSRLFSRSEEHGDDKKDRKVTEDDGEHLLAEEDYEKAIMELNEERAREFRSQVFVSATLFSITWLVGSAVYMKLEGWSFFIAFYFCFISFSSVGYGDYYPETPAGRAFFCVWALIGAATITVFFSVLADAYSARFQSTYQRSIISRLALRIYPDSKLMMKLEEREKDLEEIPGANPSLGMGHQEEELAKPDPKEKPSEIVMELINEIRKHVAELISSDSGGEEHSMDTVVRKIMDDNKFSLKNRDRVENDHDLKRFLYLRRLQDRLALLEKSAKQVIAGEGGGRTGMGEDGLDSERGYQS